MKGKANITENEISHITSKLHKKQSKAKSKKTGGYRCNFRESEESFVSAENKFNSFFLNHKIKNYQISLREFKKKGKKNWTKNKNMNFLLSKYIPIYSKKHWLQNLHTFFFALVAQKIAPLIIFIDKCTQLILLEFINSLALIIYNEIKFRNIILLDYKEIKVSNYDYTSYSELTQRDSKKTLLEAKWRITSIILENKKINNKNILKKLENIIAMLLKKKSKKNWNKNKNMNFILESIFDFNIKPILHWVRNLMMNLRPSLKFYKNSNFTRLTKKKEFNSFLGNLIFQFTFSKLQYLYKNIKILKINEEFLIKKEISTYLSPSLIFELSPFLINKMNKDNYDVFNFTLEIEDKSQQFRAWTLYPLPTISRHKFEILKHLNTYFSFQAKNIQKIDIFISFDVDKFHPLVKSFSYVNNNKNSNESKENKVDNFFKKLSQTLIEYFIEDYYAKIAEATMYISVYYNKETKMSSYPLENCTIYKESSIQVSEENNEQRNEEDTDIF